MLINGLELSSYGAQLYDRVITSNDIETVNDWIDGDLKPTVIRQQNTFKDITLKFLVMEKDEDEAYHVMSKLTAALRAARIQFDDIDLFFDVTIAGKTSQERLKNGYFILTVNLESDYAKGQTEIYTTDTTATNYFNLTVIYYKKGSVLLGTEKVLIKASDFTSTTSLESLGIDVNKYQPEYYNNGIATNFQGVELTYDNLFDLQTLIVSYEPMTYQKEVTYFLGADNQPYTQLTSKIIYFTKEQIDNAATIGQVVDLTLMKPSGYRARTNFLDTFNFANFINFTPLEVYYDKIEEERVKPVKVKYFQERDEGGFGYLTETTVVVKEGNIVDGNTLKDVINVNAYLKNIMIAATVQMPI
jgi:hypothetical protein